MVPSKPMGLPKKEYQEIQQNRSEEDFKYDTNQRIQKLQFAIDEINKSLMESIALQGSEKKENDIQLHYVMESVMLSLKEFRQQLGDFAYESNACREVLRQMKENLNDYVHVKVFNERISRLEESISQLSKDKDSVRKDFTGLIERFKSDCDTKIKTQKEEILSIPSEIPAIKKDINQKIELVELNGQNAALRSSNNEKQIMLVERKIENLYQLIKKIDISIQEDK